MESVIEKLLSAGSDTIEKLAPHAGDLTDLFIIYGLYNLSKEKGINPYFGPIAYKMMTSREIAVPEIELGFGWGATKVKIPASVRFMGALGLGALGVAVSISNLDATGIPSGVDLPPVPEISTLEGIIQDNTTITEEESPFTGTGILVKMFTTQWGVVETKIVSLVKASKVGLAEGFIGQDLLRARRQSTIGVVDKIAETHWSKFKTEVATSLHNSISDLWDFEKKIRGIVIIG